MADVLITNARIFDGSGEQPFTGDEDGVAPPQAVRTMAQRMRRVRVAILNRCGHWTPVERPEDCMRELRDFLSSQR